MRIVFFLGAGFSRPAGLPVMREFPMFCGSLSDMRLEIECFFKCVEYAQRTRAYIHGDIQNVEYLMSVLSLAAIANPDLTFEMSTGRITVEKALSHIQTLVWRVYSRMESYASRQDSYRHFRRALECLLKTMSNSIKIDIVTTNYDMLPEMLMLAIGVPTSSPIAYEVLPATPASDPPNFCKSLSPGLYGNSAACTVHKLHGSVNYFVKSAGKRKELHCWDQLFVRETNGPLFSIPFACHQDATIPKGFLPVIVPPSMVKHYDIPIVRQIWANASNAIAEADKIIFVGYSFPPSDTIMKFFLGTSLTNNHSGCRIAVIDPDADTVATSMKDIFVPDMAAHVEFIRYPLQDVCSKHFQQWTELVGWLQK